VLINCRACVCDASMLLLQYAWTRWCFDDHFYQPSHSDWLCDAAGPPVIHWGTPLTSLGGQQGIAFAKSPSMTPLLLYEQVGPGSEYTHMH